MTSPTTDPVRRRPDRHDPAGAAGAPRDEPMVVVDGLHKAFGDHEVLCGIDLEVRRGTITALLGPNGAGKTTLMSILSTLLLPDSGRAVVAGHDVVGDPAGVKRSISLTGQHAAVDDVLTGTENLVLLGRLAHLGRSRARRRAAELLAQFDLTDAADRRVGTYSGGMRRRLDIAAGLVAEPAVLLLDEPTTGLDPRARRSLWDLVERLVAGGTTILLTTQYLEEADRLADRIALLAGGRIVAEGSPSGLKRRIPGARVELGYGDADDLDRAAAALGATSGAVDHDARRLHVATDGSAASVKEVLDRLGGAALLPSSIDLRRPTLDDVFLELTGHPTDPAGTPGPAPARAGAPAR